VEKVTKTGKNQSNQNSMRTKIQMRLLLFGAILFPSILTAEEPLKFQEPVAAKITEILEIKREAMKFPSMRSEHGVLGKRSETLMAEIGEMITELEWIQKLKAREGNDIRAKIALWAVDRKNRPDEYKRFAKYYVNKPEGNEVIEYFRRNPQGFVPDPDPFTGPDIPENSIPRPGTWRPTPVDDEDQKEEFRLVLEYHYFIPPTGERFDRESYRAHLAKAIRFLDNSSRSLIVFIEDGKIAIKSISGNSAPSFPQGCDHSFVSLSLIASPESFSAISDFWNFEPSKKVIINFLTLYLNEEWEWYGSYPGTKKIYDDWIDLAKKSSEKSNDQGFGKWLQFFESPVNK
jgi:hypothetical protein